LAVSGRRKLEYYIFSNALCRQFIFKSAIYVKKNGIPNNYRESCETPESIFAVFAERKAESLIISGMNDRRTGGQVNK
jgi:hypothetical protein